MQQILLVMVRMRQGVLFRQPVVVTHQRRQPLRHGVKQRGGLGGVRGAGGLPHE